MYMGIIVTCEGIIIVPIMTGKMYFFPLQLILDMEYATMEEEDAMPTMTRIVIIAVFMK